MANQIRTIGFRNALFVGQTNQYDRPEGIGLVFDDMFLTCLANWSSIDPLDSTTLIKPSGPVLLLYPHRQIFYSDQYPLDKKFSGFWCYETAQYKIVGKGQNKNLAIIHLNSNIISQVSLNENTLEYKQDIFYDNNEEKWKKVQQITAQKIDRKKQSAEAFIQHQFEMNMNKNQKQQNFVKIGSRKSQILYGIITNNEGSAFTLKRQAEKLQTVSVGHYKSFNPLKQITFGRKYTDEINSTAYKVQEGNFQLGLINNFQFSEIRPTQSYKNSRKYFRQATNFCNEFLQFSEADEMYKKLSFIKKQYVQQIGSKYGQRIIEGQKQKYDKEHEPQESRKQKYKEVAYVNREYNLQEAKAKIEQEIHKKKALGSLNRTGNFYVNSEKKFYPDTKSNTQNQNHYRYDNSSPILKYSIESGQQTKRFDRSPRNTPKQFIYTDREEYEPIASDWRKQSFRKLNTQNMQNRYQSPLRNRVENNKQEERKVNMFTLYPVRQEETENHIYRNQNFGKTLRNRDYDLRNVSNPQREMEENIHRLLQLERQADRKRVQEFKRPILTNLNNYPVQEALYRDYLIKNEALQTKYGVPAALSSKQVEVKRKHYFNYKYTEQESKNIGQKYRSPIRVGKGQRSAQGSPVKRLNTETRKQLGKCTMGQKNGNLTRRKTFNYID